MTKRRIKRCIDIPVEGAGKAHDYRHLARRWRAIARGAGLTLQRLVVAGGHPVFFLRSPALRAEGGLYVSAGIHGDEPAGPAALLAWAERQTHRLRQLPLLLLPCLNPWGLVENRRTDADGADLNRLFDRENHPVVNALRALVAPLKFRAALMLHEDYDAQGLYLYEVRGSAPGWGEELLKIAAKHLPIDSRKRIDSYPARAGLIRRRLNLPRYQKMGWPEAIWLHRYHTRHAFTIETPSEFALEHRIRGHEAVLDEALRRVLAEVP